jgi:hypothetical protein
MYRFQAQSHLSAALSSLAKLRRLELNAVPDDLDADGALLLTVASDIAKAIPTLQFVDWSKLRRGEIKRPDTHVLASKLF